MCRSYHLVNAHGVKPVRLIQSLCAVCVSNLTGLTLLYIVLPCVVAVVSLPAWRMLVLLIARYVTNLINEYYYYCYYYYDDDDDDDEDDNFRNDYDESEMKVSARHTAL